MNRYWYLTKHTGEVRDFQQHPNGYEKFVTEVISRNLDGSFQHTIYNRETNDIIDSFSDRRKNFKHTQNLIKNILEHLK
jgi:hypothetical protein